jgi:hypothetical protein
MFVETSERRLKIDTTSSFAQMDPGKSRENTRPDRQSNRAPPKYKSETLPVKLTLSGRKLSAAVPPFPSHTS